MCHGLYSLSLYGPRIKKSRAEDGQQAKVNLTASLNSAANGKSSPRTGVCFDPSKTVPVPKDLKLQAVADDLKRLRSFALQRSDTWSESSKPNGQAWRKAG